MQRLRHLLGYDTVNRFTADPVVLSDASRRTDKRRPMSSIAANRELDDLAQPSGKRFDRSMPSAAATTCNKQLNFLQHIGSELKVGGTAAVVLPDGVLLAPTLRAHCLARQRSPKMSSH